MPLIRSNFVWWLELVSAETVIRRTMFKAIVTCVACSCLLLGAGRASPSTKETPEKSSASSERQIQAIDGIAGALRDQAKEDRDSELTEPCISGRDVRNSDLCAQWKAADAASRAALWAEIGTFVAVFGGLALLWQIRLTRSALRETALATEEMRRGNEIGERTAVASVAAYHAQIAASRPLMQLAVAETLVRARPE